MWSCRTPLDVCPDIIELGWGTNSWYVFLCGSMVETPFTKTFFTFVSWCLAQLTDMSSNIYQHLQILLSLSVTWSGLWDLLMSFHFILGLLWFLLPPWSIWMFDFFHPSCVCWLALGCSVFSPQWRSEDVSNIALKQSNTDCFTNCGGAI